jgi:HEAT repeat protein
MLLSSAIRAAEVDDLLAKLPVDNVAGGQAVVAEIVKLGPAGVKSIAGKVVPQGEGDDNKARYALSGLAFYVSRPGAEAERTMYAGAILEALDAASSPLVKTFFINQLQLTGGKETVGALSKLLDDAELCEPATMALVRINTADVPAVFVKALSTVKDAQRPTIIRALGQLRANDAASALLPYCASDDINTRRLALFAVANIGDASAGDVLAKAADGSPAYDRGHATALYLLWVRRQAEAGNKDRAAGICRELVKARAASHEGNVVCEALSTLVGIVGPAALDDLLGALDSNEKQVREGVLKLTALLPGEAVTASLVSKMKQSPVDARAEIVTALGRRGDGTALAAILPALKDADKAVRLAAANAAARYTVPQVVSALVAALQTDEADESKIIADGLARMPGENALAAVTAAIPKAGPKARIALIQIVAARHARAHFELVYAATYDKDETVRLTAIKALADLADERSFTRLIDLLRDTGDPEQSEVLRSIITAGKRLGTVHSEFRSTAVLLPLGQSKGATHSMLLRALAEFGGEAALRAVVEDTKSSDAEIRDAAIRALADWHDMSAAAELLKLANTAEKPGQQILALRGYIRLVGMPSKRATKETIQMYKDALTAAKRVDEKRLALSGLSAIRNVEALKLVATYFEDESVAAEAATAAVRIVLPAKDGQRALQGAEVVEVMKKVADLAKDQKTRDQARNYLDNAAKP